MTIEQMLIRSLEEYCEDADMILPNFDYDTKIFDIVDIEDKELFSSILNKRGIYAKLVKDTTIRDIVRL